MQHRLIENNLANLNFKFVFLISFLFLFSVGKAQLNANEIYKISSDYIVSIEVQHKDKSISTGSGFYFADINAIVTNNHVIKNFEKIKLTYFNGKDYEGTFVIATDSINDIAILRSAQGYSFKDGLKRNTEDYQIGQKIFVIGNPLGLNYTVTEGIISSIRKSPSDEIIQFTAPVSPGSSGSPILNESGQVLGVVSFQMKEGQNLNFAIPIKYVINLSVKYPSTNSRNEDATTDRYSNISTNKLLLLAENLYKNGSWEEKTRIVKTILKRSDIQDSLYPIIALKAIKHIFWFDFEADFVKSFSQYFNDYYYNNASLSDDELVDLLTKSLEITKLYNYNTTIPIKINLVFAYLALKENACKLAYIFFKSAINVNDTSTLALNGMNDFYRAFPKTISRVPDTLYNCKDKPSNFAEPDSVKYYLQKIIQYHPKFYEGYLKLIDFYFDKRSTKYYNPDIAFDYFLKCNQLDPRNPLAFKNYISKLFFSYRENKNLYLYDKAEETIKKYSTAFKKSSEFTNFIAERFKDNSDDYSYKSVERKYLLKKAIKFYSESIDYFLTEYNNNILTKNDIVLSKEDEAVVKWFASYAKDHPYKEEYICTKYLQIAEIYMDIKEFDNAYLNIQKSLKVLPNYSDNLKMLGKYYLNKPEPNYQEAIFFYKKYIEKVPNDNNVLTDLANCYADTGELELAEQFYKQVRDQCDVCYFNNYLLALFYMDTNRKDAAMKIYNELVGAKQSYLVNLLQKKLFPK